MTSPASSARSHRRSSELRWQLLTAWTAGNLQRGNRVVAEQGLADLHDAAELADLLRPWSGLVVFDNSNGPPEPVDDYLARMAAVVDASTPL